MQGLTAQTLAALLFTHAQENQVFTDIVGSLYYMVSCERPRCTANLARLQTCTVSQATRAG